ncbi:MAG TPA: DinB family protein [Flavitalea sp.]|nr:DinB family protein [Flavitalea sp.]
MKKFLTVLPLVLLLGFAGTKNELTKKEKKFAVSYLEDTRDDVINTVAGLTEDQFNYKPSAERWSVKECLQHIALAETNIRQMLDGALNQPANPEKKSEVKMTDEQLIKMMTDRSNKFQAPESFQPQKSTFETATDALNNFKMNREKLIKFVKNTKMDLRNHIATTPGGMADAYQLVLMIAAHSNRHTQQIAEVKADPGFPK